MPEITCTIRNEKMPSPDSQTKIDMALRGERSARQWMVESRRKSAAKAQQYSNQTGCAEHHELACKHERDADVLDSLLQTQST